MTVRNAKEFYDLIKKRATTNGSTLMDEITGYCEDNGIILSEIYPYIRGGLKSELESELTELRMLKRE